MIKKIISLKVLILIIIFFSQSCSKDLNKSNNSNEKESLLIRFENSINDINKLDLDNEISDLNFISKELKIISVKVPKENIKNILSKNKENKFVKYIETDTSLGLFSYKAESTPNNFSIKQDSFNPNDSFYGLQWNAKNIEAEKAWTLTKGSKEVKVAVIDSGVDPNHPDLKDNLLPMIDVWAESGKTDTFVRGSITQNYGGKDGNGHGTHITGILAAQINNATGIAGISGNVTILPIKSANNQGNTSASIITRAIIKAIENEVDIINLSIGGPKSEGTQALKDVVQLAIDSGIVFISATGNESNRSRNVITDVTVPAAYPGVIAVGANTRFDKVANYSNGGIEVEVTAPGGGGKSDEGEKIYSTWPTYRTAEGYRSGITGSYASLSGTSMSCPHVSAAAALLLTLEPNLTPQQVRVRLLSTTLDINEKGFDNATGYGRLNVYEALISGSHDKN